MAARLRKTHQEDVRLKIKVSNIITRLQKHVDGEIEMTPAQVTSAKILLDKSISNAPQEIEQKITGELQHEVSLRPQLTKEEWLKAHGVGTAKGAAE